MKDSLRKLLGILLIASLTCIALSGCAPAAT